MFPLITANLFAMKRCRLIKPFRFFENSTHEKKRSSNIARARQVRTSTSKNCILIITKSESSLNINAIGNPLLHYLIIILSQ